MTLAIIVLYLVIAVLNYGATIGYFARLYPWTTHTGLALGMAAFGPCAWPAIFCGGGSYFRLQFRQRIQPAPWEKDRSF